MQSLNGDQRSQFVLIAAVLLTHSAVAFYIGNLGWDDGTITLAFAKTFAVAGKFALTSQSAVVEGSSSALWTLIFAAIFRVFDPGFDAFIRLSQLSAAACTALSAGLLFRLIRPSFETPSRAAMVSAAVFLSAPFFNETMNGMEMSMLTSLVLAMTICLQRDDAPRRFLLVACSLAATLLRFEAALYLLAACGAMYVVDRRERASLPIVVGVVIGVLAMQVVRVLYFHDWLPNTFFAKRWPPYHVPLGGGAGMMSRLSAWSDAVLPYAGLLIPLLLLAVFPRRVGMLRSIKSNRGAVFCVGYFAAVFFFNLAIGRNWGYFGRMQLSSAPLLVFSAVLAARRPGRVVVPTAFYAIGMILAIGFSRHYLQWSNIAEVRRARAGEPSVYPTTPENFRLTGLVVDGLRKRLVLNRLTWMVPDVGGSSLCCDMLDIIDAALLTDRTLAHQGYAGFDAYLQLRSPDVIEIHGIWAQFSKIYDSRFFRSRYKPVLVANTWLYLRDDLAQKLGWDAGAVEGGSSLRGVRYRGEGGDESFVSSGDGRYLPVDIVLSTNALHR